jgi:hypothetical protein
MAYPGPRRQDAVRLGDSWPRNAGMATAVVSVQRSAARPRSTEVITIPCRPAEPMALLSQRIRLEKVPLQNTNGCDSRRDVSVRPAKTECVRPRGFHRRGNRVTRLSGSAGTRCEELPLSNFDPRTPCYRRRLTRNDPRAACSLNLPVSPTTVSSDGNGSSAQDAGRSAVRETHRVSPHQAIQPGATSELPTPAGQRSPAESSLLIVDSKGACQCLHFSLSIRQSDFVECVEL